MARQNIPSPPELTIHAQDPNGNERLTHVNTLGKYAVMDENLHVQSVIAKDNLKHGIDWLDEHAPDVDTVLSKVPAPNLVGRLAQRASGKAYFTPSQAKFAVENRREDLIREIDFVNEKINDHGTEAEMGINTARGFFRTMEGDQKFATEAYLGQILRGTVFREWADMHDPTGTVSWVDTLAHKFDDNQIMNFLQWNVHRTAEAQKKLDLMIGGQLEAFYDRVQGAVRKGWLPKEAADNLAHLDNVDFYAGDIFDTLGNGLVGYFCRGQQESNTIVVAAEKILSDKTPEKTLTHEMVHAIAGKSTEHKKAGLRYGKHNVWLDEAMTEHIAQSLVGSTDFDDAYPYRKKPEGNEIDSYGAYVEERELFTFLATQVDIDNLAKIYFGTDDEPLGGVLKQVQVLVGPQAYKDAMYAYSRAERRDERAKALKRITVLAFKKLKSDSRQNIAS
jgi:hypothetical protein